MEKVHARRLLKLVSGLREQVTRKQFKFDRWVDDDWAGDQTLSCGTTACAIGHAATMPAFRRLGMRIGLTTYGQPTLLMKGGRPRDSAASAMSTAERVFGLTTSEVQKLFCPGEKVAGLSGLPSTATPKQVARHIEKFVAERFPDLV